MYQTIELPAYTTHTPTITRRTAAQRPVFTGLLRVSVVMAVALVTLFALMMTLIGSRSYTNTPLRALVVDPTCTAPCFAGITPGVTTAAEAIDLLEAHPWVAQVQPAVNKVSFWWNGQQPALLDDSGRAFHGRLEIRIIDGVERVASIVLASRAAFGDVLLELGEPDALTLHAVAASDDTRAGVVHVGSYALRGITVFNLLECPVQVAEYWAANTFIAFGEPTLAFQGQKINIDRYKLPDGFFAERGVICD